MGEGGAYSRLVLINVSVRALIRVNTALVLKQSGISLFSVWVDPANDHTCLAGGQISLRWSQTGFSHCAGLIS